MCLRGNYRLRQRQVFEDTGRRIDFSEDVAVVRDDSEVAVFNRFHDLLETSDTKIIDNAVEPPFPGRFHHLLEEVRLFTTNTQSDRWNYLPHLLEGRYRQVEAVSVD